MSASHPGTDNEHQALEEFLTPQAADQDDANRAFTMILLAEWGDLSQLATVDIADADRTAVGPEQALDRAERACLTGPIRAQQAKDLPLADFQGHAVNRTLGAVADVQVGH